MAATEANESLRRRLRALSGYLAEFERPGFEFGYWFQPQPEQPGQVPYFLLYPTAEAFLQTLYDEGWVRLGFDWGEWAKTDEAKELRDNRESLAHATTEQLKELITTISRADRFNEGYLGACFKRGLLTAICCRAAQLEAELSGGQQ